MDLDLVTPPAGLRVKAALTTTLVAFGAAVLASVPVMGVLYFTGVARGQPGGGVTGSGYFAGQIPLNMGGALPGTSKPSTLIMATWASLLAFSVICLAVVLVASRLGRGAVGDAVFHLDAVDASGAPVGRWRNVANAALPVLAWFAAALVTNPRAGLLAVVVLWAPALLRPDRRSLYSLVTGTHYGVLPGYVRRKGPKQPPVQING